MKVRVLIFCILAYVITNTFAADVGRTRSRRLSLTLFVPRMLYFFIAQMRAVVYGVDVCSSFVSDAQRSNDAFKKSRDSRARSDNDKRQPKAQEQFTKTLGEGMTKSVSCFRWRHRNRIRDRQIAH